MSVQLDVMTFRSGQDGELLDKDAILSGKDAINVRTKVKLDSNDSPGTEPATAENVRWRLYYNQVLDLECDGHANVIQGDQAYWWTANLNSWDKERGYQAQFKLHGGTPSGTGVGAIETEHNGVVSNRITFRVD